MFVCCECRVLSGRDLCDELITRPEEFYRLWCVVVCDLENLKNEEVMTHVWTQRHTKKEIYIYIYNLHAAGVRIMKANEMHCFSNLFEKVHVSDKSTVHHQEYLNTVYTQ